MATSMPVPIEFRLPEGWHAAKPEEVGAPGAAFVALHSTSQVPGFTTNITIDGEVRSDEVSLVDVAEESVTNLAEASRGVSVSDRREIGTADAPGLTQLLTVSALIGETTRELVQCQVYLAMPHQRDPGVRAVVRLAVTAPSEQFESVRADFQEFVSSVRPGSSGD